MKHIEIPSLINSIDPQRDTGFHIQFGRFRFPTFSYDRKGLNIMVYSMGGDAWKLLAPKYSFMEDLNIEIREIYEKY